MSRRWPTASRCFPGTIRAIPLPSREPTLLRGLSSSLVAARVPPSSVSPRLSIPGPVTLRCSVVVFCLHPWGASPLRVKNGCVLFIFAFPVARGLPGTRNSIMTTRKLGCSRPPSHFARHNITHSGRENRAREHPATVERGTAASHLGLCCK